MTVIAALLVPLAAQAQVPFDATAARQRIDAVLDSNAADLLALYKDIHQHPELAFQEQRTAAGCENIDPSRPVRGGSG